MKKFCKDLREHATKIINYEKKKMIPLTIKEKTFNKAILYYLLMYLKILEIHVLKCMNWILLISYRYQD